LAADNTPAENYFGKLERRFFPYPFAYDKVRDGTPVPTATAPYRINNVESASIFERTNWEQFIQPVA